MQKGKNVLSAYFLFVSFYSFWSKNQSKISPTIKRLVQIRKRFSDKKTITPNNKTIYSAIKRFGGIRKLFKKYLLIQKIDLLLHFMIK